MSRLHRPHIPVTIRIAVVSRQLMEQFGSYPIVVNDKPGATVEKLMQLLKLLKKYTGAERLELHHRPALVNRQSYKRNGQVFYDPPANDPDHLVYLLDTDHDIETRVRGQHGQLSDLALRRKNKRIARKRSGKRSRKIAQRKNPWPPKGSRKIMNRSLPS